MISGRILLFFILGVAVACNNTPRPSTKPVSQADTPPKPADAVAEKPKASSRMSLDTGRMAAQPERAPIGLAAEKSTTPAASRSKSTWPSGYVARENAVLHAEPTKTSAKLGALKLYETVYLLETIMKDENGQPAAFPTWYKVERENKQRGWVEGGFINAGAGG